MLYFSFIGASSSMCFVAKLVFVILRRRPDINLLMETKKRLPYPRWLIRLMSLWFSCVLVIASISPQSTAAQSIDDPWATPVNLSHSGSATNPAIVSDSNQVLHVVWQDEFANYLYAQLDGDQWSAPEQTQLHLLFGRPDSEETVNQTEEPLYTGPNPLFLSGPGRYIYAVWLTPEGSLYASRVFNRSVKQVSAWHDAQRLSSSADYFAAAVDAGGELHVAYFKADDPSNPAGIYYTRSTRNGLDWTVPVLLYESSYFRTLASGEANISLATAGTPEAPILYAAWDNRARKQVLLAISPDGGKSWGSPIQVAGPAPESGLDGPFNIRVGANANNLVLVWQYGQPGGNCSQFFQSSNDAGATWSEAQTMITNLPGCAQANNIVSPLPADPEGALLLMTKIRNQVYLSAWDGVQWSTPQPQPRLSGFEDPEIYSHIEFDCLQTTLLGETRYIIGCDRGRGGDVWVTSRVLESTSSWFSPPVWSQPEPINNDTPEVEAIEMLAAGDELIHAFFTQRQDPSIYYARWDGTTWSRFTSVLQLPGEVADKASIAVGPENEFFLIVRSSAGSLYYSLANSREANTPSSWSTPSQLSITHDGRVSPADVAWGADGTIYVAYSVPVNDDRGVYLIESKDQGKSWSEPTQVFDGAAAGFEVVGPPTLQVSANGAINVIWKQQSIVADGVSQPFSLYYARSEDAGQTFSKAELVVEAPVSWREIVADSTGNLHVLWRRLDMAKTLWDQVSFDGGRSWQTPQRFPAEGGTATITIDNVGRLHLVDVGQNVINHWLWDGSRWQDEEPVRLSMSSSFDSPVELLAASVNLKGEMLLAYMASQNAADVAQSPLYYSTRMLDIPPNETAMQETLIQSPPPPTTLPATPVPEHLSTTVTKDGSGSNPVESPSGGVNSSDPTSPTARVLLPAAFLLLISIISVVSLWFVRSRMR